MKLAFFFFTASAVLSLLYWTSLVLPKTNRACKRSSQLALAPGERATYLLFFAFGRPLARRSMSPWLLGWNTLAVLCVIDCGLRET